ncbi:MAG: DUF2283 domain-containing protein [Candidatus Bathyarchaeia archaeon]
MKVEYNRESDILYIKFRDSEIKDTQMLSEDAYLDLDKDGNLIGIDFRNANNRILR